MVEGGLLAGEDVSAMSDGPPQAVVSHLTWRGHEFLELARSQTRWNHAKGLLVKAGAASFPVLMDVLTTLATADIEWPI